MGFVPLRLSRSDSYRDSQVNQNIEAISKVEVVIEEHKNRIGQVESRTEKPAPCTLNPEP